MYFTLFSNQSTDVPVRLLSLSRWGLRITWLGFAVFLFVMTHIRIPQPVTQVTSSWDKPLHLGAYFVLAFLTAMVCVRSNPLKVSHALLLPLLMLFAAFDEILQGPFGRHPDLRDWVSDCAGIVLGLLAAQVVIWFLSRPNAPFRLKIEESRSGNASGFAR